jgi:hypothetical protein
MSHTINDCIDQRQLGRRNKNSKSARDTDTRTHLLKNTDQSQKTYAPSKNDIYYALDNRICGSRGPLKQEKKLSIYHKTDQIL